MPKTAPPPPPRSPSLALFSSFSLFPFYRFGSRMRRDAHRVTAVNAGSELSGSILQWRTLSFALVIQAGCGGELDPKSYIDDEALAGDVTMRCDCCCCHCDRLVTRLLQFVRRFGSTNSLDEDEFVARLKSLLMC
nr:hypothetical protein Iba_chr01bCG6000 [Ipomoea batatas]